MQKCAVYAYDAFQFEDDGFVKEAIGLGSWSCQKLDFSKICEFSFQVQGLGATP